MKAPQRNNRQRGSVLLVIVGVLAVMLIIAAAYMSQIEIDTASSIATSDYTEARLVAEGALQAVVGGLEADMRVPGEKELYTGEGENESWDYLGDTIIPAGSLFREGSDNKTFPASDITLAELLKPPSTDDPGGYAVTGLDVYSRRHMYPDDTGGSPEYRRLKADVRIWMVDHAACLSFNHHGNLLFGDHRVLMGADPQEVDLQAGLAQWFGAGSPSTIMDLIWQYRNDNNNWVEMPSPIFGLGNGNNNRDYFDYDFGDGNKTGPANGLMDSFTVTAENETSPVWCPLKRFSFGNSDQATRFSLEDELVLQRMRATGRYLAPGQASTDSSEWPSRLARVLNAGGVDPENNTVLQQRLKVAARSFATVSRTQAFARVEEPDNDGDGQPEVSWIPKIDINELNTDVTPDSEEGKAFRDLCVLLLGDTPKAANLAGAIAMFTSDYAESGLLYTFGSEVNDWVKEARVPVAHRLPVVAGYMHIFVKGEKKDDPDKAAFAVQIFNPFERPIPLNLCTLAVGEQSLDFTAAHGIQALGGKSSMVVLFQPKGIQNVEPALDTQDKLNGIYVQEDCFLHEVGMEQILYSSLSTGQVPEIVLKYAPGAPKPYGEIDDDNKEALIDTVDAQATNKNSETEVLIRMREHPFIQGVEDTYSSDQPDVSLPPENKLQEYEDYAKWRDPGGETPILHLGGRGDKFASPAQVGLLLNGPMSRISDDPDDKHSWFDPGDVKNGRLGKDDFVKLHELVVNQNDFFDCTRTYSWPDDPTIDMGRININTADFYDDTPRTLLTLPWMGEDVAKMIMQDRPFRSIGELVLRYKDGENGVFNESEPIHKAWKTNGKLPDNRFDNLSAEQQKHAVQFLFGLLCNRATTRSHMFTVRVQVTLKQVDDDGAVVGDPLCTEALTAIVDRSTGKCRILNKFWGAPIVEE